MLTACNEDEDSEVDSAFKSIKVMKYSGGRLFFGSIDSHNFFFDSIDAFSSENVSVPNGNPLCPVGGGDVLNPL
tara:strand:- start:2887 stop:3108 length:222 start_codon:yes stop_codon:yes gene_type:complete